MPYAKGDRLPAETTSRLGHLDVLNSELVKALYKQFEASPETLVPPATVWQPFPPLDSPLKIIFGVDGSIQTIRDERPPGRELAFVKTALLRLDPIAMSKLNQRAPHPFAIRDLMKDAAVYHATVFPLKNIRLPNRSVRNTVRQVIFESMNDASLEGEVLSTLRWLAYQEWSPIPSPLSMFECPHCDQTVATLPIGSLTGQCPGCSGDLFLTDWLGFHLDMADDSAPENVATAYMLIHETLLMFTAIKFFWNHSRGQLSDCLFVKDGPLAIRAQYSKLVIPIRRFLEYAMADGYPIHLIGQEKSGLFYDHLGFIASSAPSMSIMIPDNTYISSEIRRAPMQAAPYGRDTNYGAKVFVKLSDSHSTVLSIPTGRYIANPTVPDLIGIERILATLPGISGHLHEGSLLPIERAHAVASLSTYPSAAIFKLFAQYQKA